MMPIIVFIVLQTVINNEVGREVNTRLSRESE